jgi:RodZ C-terminal domain
LTGRRDLGQLLRIVSDSTQTQDPTPFDERSALAELEQLADKIQLSRRQREKAVAEFDAFVNTFRYDRYTQSIAATDRELRRAEDRSPVATTAATHAARAQVPPAAVTTPSTVPLAAAPAAVAPPATAAMPATPATVVTPVVGARGSASPAVDDTSPWGSSAERESITQAPGALPRIRAAHVGVGLATIAVLAVAVLLWRSSSGPVGPAAPTNPSAASSSAAPAAQPPAEAAPAPKPVAPPGPPRALNIEFITTRPVWARITIDGRKAMEREFPADQRIPLGADRSILIRAGDAGAVRLVVDGKDLGLLGKDGQIFSRAFTPAVR